MRFSCLCGFLFFCWFSGALSAQKEVWNLNGTDWLFYEAGSGNKYPAEVPGTVHTDLLRNGRIPDPFYGTNEDSVQWVAANTWVYEKTFRVPATILDKENVELVCEGLDTYASVFVNDTLVLEAGNMFRSWKVKVKTQLKNGENNLRIVFYPAGHVAQLRAGELPYTLPGEERVQVRKAQYQFGWDWGPRILTAGIWKRIYINAWSKAQIHDLYFYTSAVHDSVADVRIVINLEGKIKKGMRLLINLWDEGMNQQLSYRLKEDELQVELAMKIHGPVLWWCNGMGRPHTYHLDIKLEEGENLLDNREELVGIRTIELVQEPDSAGQTFYFKLNGVPLFIKGANVIPQDIFLPRIKKEDYGQLVQNAADASMNMLRVWGGGVYEDDEFYRQCDEKGILVWQDFMFACAMYPGDALFLENVEAEVYEQVIRLRNHASLALWCGNNENQEGWDNWGWQKQYRYSSADSAKIYHDYQQLFNAIIPGVLEKTDPRRAYHPSSPAGGWGRASSYRQGDVHYWGVWWGHEPFEAYKEHAGRFVSEYGFQGMPDMASLRKFVPDSQLYKGSPSLKQHQKHPTGYETIEEAMRRYYTIPQQLEDYVYISQLVQAYGIETAILAHRLARPYCMGTLYWQLNDCWPVTSWSSTDRYNQPKAVWYKVKQDYAPVVLIPVETDSVFCLHGVNDRLLSYNGVLTVGIYDLKGKCIFSESLPAEIPGEGTRIIWKKNIHELPVAAEKYLLRFQLATGDSLVAERYVYRKYPNAYELEKPQVKIKRMSENYIAVSCSGFLAKDVYLSSGDAVFSDNYFDLLPGETKVIRIQNWSRYLLPVEDIQIKMLNDLH